MTRSSENRCFRRFQETRDPRLLAKVFDATAAELLRVAGHLSNGDRELTQDVLQATFLTAIERAGSYDTERDVRPWLLGILANHVRNERRRTSRYRGSDVTEAGLMALDSPIADVQVLEFGEAAKAAMKKLPAPFKEAIVFHLQHGLTAAEIGEALGRPAGTVRTQIVRGMDRLRALLPAGFTAAALGMMLTPGPVLAAVRSNVLATLPPVAIASSSFFLASWRLYTMIGASLAVVLSVLFSWLAAPPVAPPVSVVEAGKAPSIVTMPEVPNSRVVVATNPPAATQPAPVEVEPQRPDNLQRVALKVVYKGGNSPAANVPLGMRVDGHYRMWTTDAKGRCELWLPWPGIHELYVIGANTRAMIVWHQGQSRPRVHKARMEIEAGMDIDVRVVDADGNAVVGATVESSHGNRLGDSFLTSLGKTDANGRLQRRHVPVSGKMRVWAPGYLLSGIRSVEGKVGEVTEAKFRLKSGALSARGRVVDENGKPIAGAQLALVPYTEAPYLPQFLMSDRAGNFELHTMRKGKHVLVGMHNAGTMRRGELRFVHDGLGDKKIELQLTRGARVIGVLKSPTGQPMARTNVTARHRPEGIEPLPFFRTWTRTAADGSFELRGLAPGGYELETDKAPSQRVSLRDRETYEWNPTRTALLPISIRLLDTGGKPLEGWSVRILEPGSDFEDGGVITGTDGRPRYAPRDWGFAPGSYCRFNIYQKLGTDMENWHDHSRQPSLRTPPLVVGQNHEIRLPASAFAMHDIAGTVRDHTGASVPSAKVEMAGVLGWSHRMVAPVDAITGAFKFEDLPPGRYYAHVKMSGRPNFTLPPIDVSGARVASYGEVRVPDTGSAIVTLPAAAPTKGLSMRIVNAYGVKFTLRQQPDGSWRSPVVHHGDYELRGWSATSRVTTRAFKLAERTVTVAAAVVPHAATKVVVTLPPTHPRSGSSWSGTLTVRSGGKEVANRHLRHKFENGFEDRIEFLVSLPAGDLDVKVKGWDRSSGSTRILVAANGGGEVVVQIR